MASRLLTKVTDAWSPNERLKKMIHECDGISDPVVRGQDSSRFVSRSHLDSISIHHFDIKTVELWLVSRPLKISHGSVHEYLDATGSRDFRSTTP